jgi:glucose-6-phosphate 1-dehydrogenase
MKMPATIFTIFGITGDLTQKKLLPALYNLEVRGLLPKEFYIVGFARREWSADFLKKYIRETIEMSVPKADKKVLKRLLKNVYYLRGDFTQKKDYKKLRDFLEGLERAKQKHINKIFYLAVAPSYFPKIFRELGDCGLSHGKEARILIEKPFGLDKKSAEKLTKILLRSFKEDQIYRIDHYLAKQSIQNILSLRFANGIFEKLWSNKHIDNIQISATMEQIGVEHRGQYYEETGAMLDIIQNHGLQMIALICMQQPRSLKAEHIRDEKYKILRKVRAVKTKDAVVLGQYTAGTISAKKVAGYREEENVSPNSKTETFAAMKFLINSPRWRGVPIYVRTGKRLEKKYTDIVIEFKQPHVNFLGDANHSLLPNLLKIRMQPDESISLRLMVKEHEFDLNLEAALMNFAYEQNQKIKAPSPGDYEKIIFDALRGSQALFVRSDSVIQQWKIIEDLAKKRKKYQLHFYKAGSRGPAAQEMVLRQDQRKWWSDQL